MTTETITIVVNEKGARVVKRNIEDIGKGAKSSITPVNQLNRALAAVGATVSTAALIRLVDTYTNLQNRIRLVTDGQQQLNGVMRELFSISNSTRSAFEGTAEVYARTALATKELGISQRETLDFTKSLNQAVILSGASATEANAAMIQLSQGLASGTLRGDELRSVMEQLPAVADVIAKGLGVTRGELRQMGFEGKITAKAVLDAFKSAREELNNKFATTIPTIGQAFVVLKNNITQFLGELNDATGASAALASIIITVAENVDVLAKAVVLATAAWVAYKLAANAAAIAAVTTAILGNIAAFIQLASTVRTVAGAMALLNATFLVNPLVLIPVLVVAAITALILFRKKLLDLLRNFEFFGTNVVEIFAFLADAVVATWSGIFEVIKGFIDKLRIEFFKFAESINQALGRQLIPTDKIIGSDVLAVMERAGNSAGENFKAGFDRAIENGFLARELSRGIAGSGAGAAPDLSLTGPDLTPDPAVAEALERQKELLESLIAPTQDFGIAIQDLNALYNQGLIDLETYNNALANQELQFLQQFEATTFAQGFVSQLRIMQLETRNAVADMGKQFATIFGPGGQLSKGIGDAVAQAVVFGKSFKESIHQVAQSILSQLISALVQVGVNMLINATLGQALMAASTAATAAAASATAAAWAPAAALASLASFGSNAAAAQAGIATTIASTQALAKLGGGLPGFEEGGFTGNVSTKQIAGVVHGQEFVMNAAATARNRPMLEAMNRGDSPGSSAPVNIRIINEIPDAEFETNQLNENDVEIIARRVVRQDAPGVIAADISNPNSRTSKALSKNTQVQRRRN